MNRLDGKICLITGGARGQGAAEARLFASEGAKVWICDLLSAEGEAVAVELDCQYRRLDVCDEAGWQMLIEEIISRENGIDVLINNAGIFRANRLLTTDMDEFNLVMDINCNGVFLGMRTVAGPMIESGGGSIVNISSIAGLRAAVGAFSYGASKWAVRGMTKTAAVELARKGVRVNSIHPGLIETPMAHELGPNIDKMTSRVPLGRIAQADEVAQLALFLASDESAYSTGCEFVVDGGITAL